MRTPVHLRLVAGVCAALLGSCALAAPVANWAAFARTTTAEETTHTLTQGEWTLTIPGRLDTATGAITLTGAATLTGTGGGTGTFSLMADLEGTPSEGERVFAFTSTGNNVGWLKFTGSTLNLGHSENSPYNTTSPWDGTRAKLTVVHGSSEGTNVYKDGASILGEGGLKWSGNVYKSFTIGLAGMKLYGVSLYTERLTTTDALSAAAAVMRRAEGYTTLALDEAGKPLRSNYTGNISTGTAGRGQVSVTQNSWVNYTSGGNAGVNNGAGLTATDANGAFYNLLLTTGTFTNLGENNTWVEDTSSFTAATAETDTWMTFNGASNAASLNIQSGRWDVGSSGGFANVATIFLTGGQLWLDGDSADKTGTLTRFVLGTSNYSEGNAYGNAALRADATATLSTVEVIENAKITQAGSTTLTLSTLSGSGNLTFATYSGTPDLTIGNAAGYTGVLSKPNGTVTLNSGTTFGGELQQAAGTLTLAGTGGHTVKKVAASGSALTIALGSNADSVRENIQALSLGSATVTVTQTSWNNFISVGSLDGSGTLKWNQTTNHYTPSTLSLTGDNTGFAGSIEAVRASGSTDGRPYQHYLVAASDTALGSANLYLNGANALHYSSLAVNADSVTVGTLRGTAYAYVLSGLTEPAENSGCALREGDGTDRTLKLIGAQDGTWLGTIGPHLNIEVAGSGTWEVGDGCLGSGTVTLTSGTLVLPVQSEAQTITPNAEGCTGTLVLRLSDAQLASRSLTTNVRWSGELSQVKVWDSRGVEQTQFSAALAESTGDLVLTNASAIWSPTDANHAWGDTSLWSGQSVPTDGTVTINCSALTAPIAFEIPAAAQLTKVVVTGFESAAAAQLLTLSLAEGATIGTLELLGHSRVQLPCAAAITTRSVGSNAILTLDGGAATAEAPASLPTFTGTGTVSLTNGYATTAPFADFTGTLNLEESATLRVNNGAAVKSCRAITGSGTLRFQGVVPNVTGGAVDGLPGISDRAEWTGTITLANITGTSTQLRPDAYGNANSTVEFDGVAGWMSALTIPRLRLTGEGLTLSNGSSTANANIIVNTLVGTGKFQGATSTLGKAWMYSLLIGSAADFEGSFELTPTNAYNSALVIQIGSTAAPSSTAAFVNHISIVGGAAVEAKKPWTPASNGNIRVVNGSLTLTGEQARIPSSFDISAEGSVTIATTGASIHAGALIGSGPFTVNAPVQLALTGANGNYTGAITVASGATLTNAGSTASVPFGKGTIENNGTVKLMGTGTSASCGQLPPTSGSGNIVFCAGSTSRIPGEITTTGTVTFEPASGEDAAAAAVTFVSNSDFAEKVASINGASVVVGAGVTLAKDATASPSITIAAGKSLSGSGTINVPVAFENETTATMPSDASLTFGSTLAVPKNVTLPGTVKLASTAVISGTGTLSGTVTFAEGATIDATASTVENPLVFTGTPTFAATIPVKVAKLCSLFSVPSTVSLTAGQVSLTWAESAIAGSKVMLSTVGNTTTARLFVPPTVSVTEDPENPREAGVSDAIAQAAETWAGWGWVISEVTAISATGTDGKSTRDVNAAALFDGVLSLTPDTSTGNGTYTATATVTYDFGIAEMTIKRLQLTGDDATKLYVLLAAKVQNSASSNTASFASGTELSVLNGETELTPKSVSAAEATGIADAEETAGVQWLAVPLATLFPEDAAIGTQPLKVKASKAAASN